MKMFDFKVYTIKKYKNIFKSIKALKSDLNHKEICDYINKNITLSIYITNQIHYEKLKNFKFYRLRIPNRKNKKLINNVGFYSYPPNGSQMGRANLENQVVFYASADANTAIFELKKYIKPLNRLILLSVWRFKPFNGPVNSRNLFYGIPENIEDNLASILSTGLDDKLNSVLKDMPDKIRHKYLYGQKKLSEMFTWKGKKYYHITSAIANDTLFESKKQNIDIPILSYPSVAKNRSSVNFAIRSDFVDQHLQLEYVLQLKVNKINDTLNAEVLAKGVPNDNIIEWSQPKIKQTVYRPLISKDGELSNGLKIPKDVKFTFCCMSHAFTIECMAERLSLHDKLNKLYGKIPLDFYAEFPLVYHTHVVIKLSKSLYIINKISDLERIRYLIYPVQVEFRF